MITIALPKGYLLQPSMEILQKAGAWVPPKGFDRQLSVEAPDHSFKYLLIRPSDVPVYVEHGAADLGVVGKDVLAEGAEKVVELLDLKMGHCRLVVAAPKVAKLTAANLHDNLRVGSKFTHCAQKYFNDRGLKVEIIKLYGSVELAPLTGLSDVIVDLVATGKTLAENGLVVVDTVLKSSARLVANSVRYRLHYDVLHRFVSNVQKYL
jgi:ATP phosphoribosyltransferase